MTNYKRGVKYERELKKVLEKEGYNCMRTAGSHGTFDLIAWKDNPETRRVAFVAMIQCKIEKQKRGKVSKVKPRKPPTPAHFGIN